MKDIGLLIGGKIINGLFGLLLFFVIKQVLLPNLYIEFSNCLALLTLIATFSAGAISGLMLKRAFNSKHHSHIVVSWLLFFLLLTIIAVELLIFTTALNAVYRWPAYAYLLTNALSAVVMVDFQINQKFVAMSALDSFRIFVPLVAILVLVKLLAFGWLSVAQILWLLVLGNLYGAIYFLARTPFQRSALKDFSYLQQNWKSDLAYSFWFSSFNALAQLVVTIDRQLIAAHFAPLLASKIAYTADQVTRIANGIVFPINTKVSSQLGTLIKEKAYPAFAKAIQKGFVLSLAFGLFLTGLIVATVFVVPQKLVNLGIDWYAALLYGFGVTLYLAILILQKRFDYTRYKALPFFTLLFSFAVVYVSSLIYPPLAYSYAYTMLLFFIMMVAVNALVKDKLKLDR